MPDSLTQRLRTTPHLIAECDGCTVVEPLQFIPIAAAPSDGDGGRPAASAPCGGSLANVSDQDVLESYARLQSACRVAKELGISAYRARNVLKTAKVEMKKGAKLGTLHNDGMHFTVEPHAEDFDAVILRHPKGAIIIDRSDFHLVDGRRLNFMQSRKNASIYVRISMPTGDKSINLARAIMSCPDAFVVDHIDGNTFDNRRQNLRVCLHAENSRNRKKGLATKSTFKGVTSAGSRWMAVIMVDRKQHSLGTFETEVEAAKAYDEAARIHHGKFAAVNFPKSAGERCAITNIVHAATANGKVIQDHG